MRVTEQAKAATRKRILDATRKMLSRDDFESLTTREFAAASGVANGTLFNYFPSKESLLIAILAELLAQAETDYFKKRRGKESLDEDLFLFIQCGLRRMNPHRAQLS